MRRFDGFCVGGPKAGLRASSEGPTFRTMSLKRLPFSLMHITEVPDVMASAEYTTYYRVPVKIPDAHDRLVDCDFFTVDRPLSLIDILDVLAKGYAEREKIDREAETNPPLAHYVARALREGL